MQPLRPRQHDKAARAPKRGGARKRLSLVLRVRQRVDVDARAQLAQCCWAEGCSRAERQGSDLSGGHTHLDPPWLRARNRARNRGGADDPGSDGGFEALDDAEGGTSLVRTCPSRPTPAAASTTAQGCATGACKLEPPPSRLHVPSGSTCRQLSGGRGALSAWWSDGGVRTDRSPANHTLALAPPPILRGRQRRGISAGRVTDCPQLGAHPEVPGLRACPVDPANTPCLCVG